MKILEERTSTYDIEELACQILGLNIDDDLFDYDQIESRLIDTFEIDFDNFQKIINRLLPLILVSKSPISNEYFKGFASIERGIWLVKMLLSIEKENPEW